LAAEYTYAAKQSQSETAGLAKMNFSPEVLRAWHTVRMRIWSRISLFIAIFSSLSAAALPPGSPACKSQGGGTLAICRADGEKFKRTCNQVMTNAKGQEAASTAQLSSQVKNNAGQYGKQQLAQSGGQQTDFLKKLYADAAASCEACMSACESSCKNVQPAEQAQAKQVIQSCRETIAASAQEARAGSAANESASGKNAATEEAARGDNKGSGGMPPMQMPQLPQAEAKPETPAATQPQSVTETQGPDCSRPDAYIFAECATKIDEECAKANGGQGDFNSERCAGFKKTACQPATGTSQASRGALQQGSGIGGKYCTMSLANGYCTPGREMCPSCGSNAGQCRASPESCMSGKSADELSKLKNICGDDPLFANPKAASALSTALNKAGVAGGGAGGGGGGASLGSGQNARLDEQAKREKESFYKDPGSGNSEGGGGGGGSAIGAAVGVDGDTDFPSRNSGKIAGRATAADAPALPSDVQKNQYGPSVFAIFSEVMKNRCQKGLFIHCAPKK
jgi:hypothetical protein